MDFAKRLLDFGFHAPTTYFPLLVPECLLIEPTETESQGDARCLRRRDGRRSCARRTRIPSTLQGRAALACRCAGSTTCAPRKQLDLTMEACDELMGADAIDRDKPRGLTRLLRAFGASWQGLARRLARGGRVPPGTACFAALVMPLGLWLGRSGVERALLVAPVLLILIVELLNSAIEADRRPHRPERHELAGLAKDIGSAAVFVSFVLLAGVWLLVLLGLS